MQCTGAGVGEGESYQGVHVDDGSATVGTLDQLVPQTAHLHAHLGAGFPNPFKGIYTVRSVSMHTCIHMYGSTSEPPTNTESSVFIRILKLITDEELKYTDD